jgi:uncharacterized protein YccT (UPF0319 family)
MCLRLWLTSPACWNAWATIETARRRTPIISARYSWVSGNPSLSHKSGARNNRRGQRWSVVERGGEAVAVDHGDLYRPSFRKGDHHRNDAARRGTCRVEVAISRYIMTRPRYGLRSLRSPNRLPTFSHYRSDRQHAAEADMSAAMMSQHR